MTFILPDCGNKESTTTLLDARQTCFGRLLGLGPWYLTTPVQDATKKLHIISTKDL